MCKSFKLLRRRVSCALIYCPFIYLPTYLHTYLSTYLFFVPTVPVLQNPHKWKTVSPTMTPPENILPKIRRSPLYCYQHSFKYVTGFKTIVCDLSDLWPKITQEIRAFFVIWTECFHGYRYEDVFRNKFSIFFDFEISCLFCCSSSCLWCSRCEAAWTSGELASQRRHFPACHAFLVKSLFLTAWIKFYVVSLKSTTNSS